MDLGLTGRVALVTGAGSGIGRAIALRLADEGARVGVLGRQEGTLRETCDLAQGEVLALPADLAEASSLEAALERLQGAWGSVSVLVHCAARFSARRRLEHASQAEWLESWSVNMQGATHLTNLLLPAMRGQRWGRVVAVSSMMAQAGGRGYALYSTMKAAQEALIRGIALDYGPFGITANAVAPGFIATEHFQATATAEFQQQHAAAAALSRLGRPEEVAAAVAFLASEPAGFITGTTLRVGGGAHLNTRW